MKIIFLGDVDGKAGRQAVASFLPQLRSRYKPDVVIANVENASHGAGINSSAYRSLLQSGIDVMTTGDHVFDKKEAEDILEQKESKIIRPLNYPENADIPGKGYTVYSASKGELAVVNLQGRVFMKEGMDNPFWAVDKLLKNTPEISGVPTIVDFHTEATSEISAMGHFLDGRVSAVLGTHTHVQTNDAQLLARGTAFISDVGMCGAVDSVIGVRKDIVVNMFLSGLPAKFEVAKGKTLLNGAFLELEEGKAKKIELICERER